MRDVITTNKPTTGERCVYGHFTANDMQWMMQLAPSGEFSPNFHTQRSSKMTWVHYMLLRKNHGFLGAQQMRPFWFSCNAEDLTTLLVALYLRGFLSPDKELAA